MTNKAIDPKEDVKQPQRPKLLEIMGPGLITGASDDDPSGIATYSQAGAQYGVNLGWTLILILAVEAYHAGIIRTLCYQSGLAADANKISALRNDLSAAAGKPAVTDQGIRRSDRLLSLQN